MKMTVLVENNPGNGLEGEHGLSLWIQYKDMCILLDAGQSGLFLKNGEKLNIPFEKTEFAVLSHGHYDHSGGFGEFLKRYPDVKVYAREKADRRYFSKKEEGMKDIGIPQPILKEYGDNFVYLKEDTQAAPGVWLIGHHGCDLTSRGAITGLYKKEEGKYLPDDFMHEQSLVFEEEKGLVICNSCSHAGMDQIVKEVMEVFPGKKILAVAGGFHLKAKNSMDAMAYPQEEVERLGRELVNLGVEHVYTGHCTGNKAFQVLKTVLGERLHSLDTGNIIFI